MKLRGGSDLENKMFELMEKMYSEFSSFKTDLNTEVKGIRRDLTDVIEEVKSLNVKVDKNALGLETIDNRLEIVAEVQQNMMGQTQKQIQEIIEPFGEDVSVIKSAVKHISNEVVDVSDKIEFISMKEFNNERDLFLMKKKHSHKDSNLD